jgi:predicted GH43/DUF377 family glycosyl hydrolase
MVKFVGIFLYLCLTFCIGSEVAAKAPQIIHAYEGEYTEAIFDGSQKLWKKWRVISNAKIFYSESKDGSNWTQTSEPAFEKSNDASDWDHSVVNHPVIVFNEKAPKSKRYMLFYSAYNDSGKYPFGGIGLATSSDGKNFTRLNESLSAYKKQGLVVSTESQEKDNEDKDNAGAILFEPQIIWKDGNYHMWCSKIYFDDSGDPSSAGISHAISKNAISWKVSSNDLLKFCFGKKTVDKQYLKNKLHNISTVYREVM